VLTGGSPLLVSGLSSVVPIQVGLSADPVGTPTFNLTLNSKSGAYFKGAVQRSVRADGLNIESETNGIGLDFGARGAKALYIGEVGFKQQSAAGSKQAWLRAGVLYNMTRYIRFSEGGLSKNWSLFAAVDRQVTQPNQEQTYRGMYIGASIFYAPPNVNIYSQYYGGRLYILAPFASRPNDSLSLTANYSRFSTSARTALLLPDVYAPRGQLQINASYSLGVARGVHLSPSLGYVNNPAFGQNAKGAMLVGMSIFTQF